MNGVEPPACVPLASSSGSNENQVELMNMEGTRKELEPQTHQTHESSDIIASQESVGGMMRITPSDYEVSSIFLNHLLL